MVYSWGRQYTLNQQEKREKRIFILISNIGLIYGVMVFLLSVSSLALPQLEPNKAETPHNKKEEITQPEVNQSPKESVGEIPKFNDYQTILEPFVYDPNNRKDPFKPYMETEPIDKGELQGPLLPLQRFDTSEIKLVGIIWDVSAPKAMFLDPTNTVHIIGKNERLGRNNGYIAAIREGEVVIVEATHKENEVVYTTTLMKISR